MKLMYEIDNPSEDIITKLMQFNNIDSAFGLNNNISLTPYILFDENKFIYDINDYEMLVSDIFLVCIKKHYTSLYEAVEYMVKHSNNSIDYYISTLGKWFYAYWSLTDKNKKAIYQDIIENTTLEFSNSEVYYEMSCGGTWSYNVYPQYNPKPKLWLTMKEAAEYLNVGYDFIRKGVNNNTLIASKKPNGKMVRINVQQLDAWAERGFQAPESSEEQEIPVISSHKQIYKPYEVAFASNCSETYVRKQIRKGDLKSHGKDGITVVYYEDMVEWQLSR